MSSTFEKAREFMYRNARPLDLARFQYHFENGSKESVVKVLSFYQNTDGGCGHAVEADCWNPNSTPLHTSGACDILREIDFADREHPFVQGLLKWYASGKDFNGKSWAITVESNNDYPHAPWWHTDSVSSCHTDYNGTVQMAGFLVRYAKPDSELFRLGVRIVNEATEALLREDLADMHTCGCYIHMKELLEKADATHLAQYDALTELLRKSVNSLICRDTAQWGSYVCKPSNFLNSTESEYYADNREVAEQECEYIINSQQPDGAWAITWNWEDYPEEWAVSKNWWKGHLIIQNLLYLKGMGRLDETGVSSGIAGNLK